ncbi:MAG: phosphatase PAP2 family protein [Acidimicrobiales bacterium]|nr:phosphatase PAP2 family protein [Acidimicrobiales bacterium]
MWLPWDYALGLAAVLAVIAGVARQRTDRRSELVAAVAAEATIVALLYTLWQLAGRLSVINIEGAYDRADQLWDLERALFLPDEAAVQGWLLPHELWVQASNIYYAGAHVPGMGIFLVWMFFRHRDRYRPWRNVLAALTGACLLIQLVPVAPPRFIDRFGIVDTGIEYGQSVYASFGSTAAGQLQAMPSIHVAWAMLIALALWPLGGWARWMGVAHAVLTNYVVVVTGNHYWLDGVVAAVLLVGLVPIERWVRDHLVGRVRLADMGEPVDAVVAAVGE